MYRAGESYGTKKVLLSQKGKTSSQLLTDYLFREANSGHVCSAIRSVEFAIGRKIDSSDYSQVVIENGFVYLKNLWEKEEQLAKKIKELISVRPAKGFRFNKPEIVSSLQFSAMQNCIDNSISIISGSPGVGKTLTAVELARAGRDFGFNVKMMAPTGKAASRLLEGLLVAGITQIHPSTIHRGLEWIVSERTPEGFPRRHSHNPINADLVIVDELSMVPLALMADLFDAVRPGTRVILIGDPNQLAPVGPGQPFIDLLAWGRAPAVELIDVFRQARGSKIWLACKAILNQSPYEFYKLAAKDSDEIVFNPIDSSDRIKSFFSAGIKNFIHSGKDPFTELQILTPIRDAGPASALSLNKMASKLINPEKSFSITLSNGEAGKENDKVIQLKNNYIKEVFNGDQGRIKKAGQMPLIVESIRRGRRQITWSRWPAEGENASDWPALRVSVNDVDIPYTEEEAGSQLALSYALTIHRYQGSQAPHVAVACPVEGWGMMGRRLFLTAISRAQKRVVVAGSPDLITRAIITDKDSSRRSGLLEKLNK